MKRNAAAAYYKILACIRSSKNEIHLEKCQEMLGRVHFKFVPELMTEILIKRCELLITIYQEVE